jgi:hypothetical protein
MRAERAVVSTVVRSSFIASIVGLLVLGVDADNRLVWLHHVKTFPRDDFKVLRIILQEMDFAIFVRENLLLARELLLEARGIAPQVLEPLPFGIKRKKDQRANRKDNEEKDEAVDPVKEAAAIAF